jgi:2-methylcitrate dehydratase
LWGTKLRAHPDLAALVNGSLLRCFDYNISTSASASGHPSDMVAGVIAAGEWIGASGEELLVALAVGYGSSGDVRRVVDGAGRLGLHQPHRG